MIRDKILEMIKKELMVEDFDADADIQKVYDLDSISLLDFIMSIEEEFDIEISEAELNELKTVNQIISLVEAKKGN